MTAQDELRRRIGQLVVAGFEGLTLTPPITQLIRDHYLGHVILFSRNVATPEQLRQLTHDLQHLAQDSGQTAPLTISCDQENGIVRRWPEALGGLPGNMALGAIGSVARVREAAQLTGRVLRALGINWNLAPVLDVNNNPANPVIGVRSFSDSPDTVATLGVAFLQGLQSQGVIACGKHFPGHGDTAVDSHLALPRIDHDRPRLDALELVPFRAAIAAGIDALMTAHVVFPAVEPSGVPATLSSRVLTGLLRDELGFTGVLTTDCLEMNAIADTVGVAQGAVQALQAGADLVMISHRLDRQLAAFEAIEAAVRHGELPEWRIEEAYQRVQALKQRRLATPDPVVDWPPLQDQVHRLAADLSAEAVTVIRQVPLPPASRVAVLIDETAPAMVAAGPGGKQPLLADALKAVFPAVEVSELSFAADRPITPDVVETLTDFPVVLAGLNGSQNPSYLALLATLSERHPHLVACLLRSPYDVSLVPTIPTVVALYETTPWMAKAAIKALWGLHEARGRLPVQL